MILSMTGFGKGTAKNGEIVAEAEIKSLNSRFLDLSVKLPKDLSDKEFEIREKIRKKINRGKISLYVTLKHESGSEKFAAVDIKALDDTVRLLKKVLNKSGIDDKLRMDHLLSVQHLYFLDSLPDLDQEYSLVETAIDEAIGSLIEMKAKEGETLKKDLLERVNNIGKATNEVKEKSHSSVEEYFDKLKQRAAQLVSELSEYPDRLNMELAILSEKYDVTEECVRLSSHIDMFLDTMENNNGEVGRKLNFISQEMNREANTINSKSVASNISHLGIFIKEELEKIREQIQNLE